MSWLTAPWTKGLLLACAGLLLVSSVVAALRVNGASFRGLNSLERWFWVDREEGLPAWFSTILLFLCAQALWRLAATSSAGGRRRWYRHEVVLAAVFLFLSIDELTAIHEQSITPIQHLFNLGGALTFSWIVFAAPLTAVLGIFMIGYLRALPRRSLVAFLVAGAVYVGGAAGVEMIGSQIFSDGGMDGGRYAVAASVEEAMEMVGAILFLRAVNLLRQETTPS